MDYSGSAKPPPYVVASLLDMAADKQSIVMRTVNITTGAVISKQTLVPFDKPW